jgi:hypothetical protein
VKEIRCALLSLGLSLGLPQREDAMIRHPQFLEVPWDFHPVEGSKKPEHHVWWLILALLLVALCLIGIGLMGDIAE